MKIRVRTPFFETSVKNYIYGDAVLEYARIADEVSREFDVDVLFVAPYTDIRRVKESTDRLIVLAPYMDPIRPGRGIADVLPEALKAAGAQGVVLNHSERPVPFDQLKKTLERANELDFLTFVCSDTIENSKKIALLHPDIMNPEPTELIGSGKVSDMCFVRDAINAIKSIDASILIEQAAGITTPKQVYDFIMNGSDAVGSASGILTSDKPYELLKEMVRAVSQAREDLEKKA